MKSFSPTLTALLKGAALKLVTIGRLSFPSGTVYASDATDDIAWNGHTYTGLDQCVRVDVPPSTLADTPPGGTVYLSATDPTLLTPIQAETYRAQPAEVAVLIFDPSTGLPVEEIIFLKGKMDVASISDSERRPPSPGQAVEPQVSTLSLSIANAAADLKRTGSRTQSDADQRKFRDANDGFFKDKGVAGHQQIWWGQNAPATGNSLAAQLAGGAPGSIRNLVNN